MTTRRSADFLAGAITIILVVIVVVMLVYALDKQAEINDNAIKAHKERMIPNAKD